MSTHAVLIACLVAPLFVDAHQLVEPLHAGSSAEEMRTHRLQVKTGFEENKGQVRTADGGPAPFVRYRYVDGNMALFLLDHGIAYQFQNVQLPAGSAEVDMEATHHPLQPSENERIQEGPLVETYRMDMVLDGANPAPRITAEGRSVDHTHYYTHGALAVYSYTKVTYHDVWQGIDMLVHLTTSGMKYDFVVHPGADPAQVGLRFDHHQELYLDPEGNLVHGNRMGRFVEDAPVSFQNGKAIPTRFELIGDRLRFVVEGHDPTSTLIIDPARTWGTYYGGAGTDFGRSAAVDVDGNVYLTGQTTSAGGTAIAEGGHQVTFGGGTSPDAFLVKFDSAGVRQWATYYGGSGEDYGFSCAVDPAGSVYMCGATSTTSGMAADGHQMVMGGLFDAYLVKFDPSGELAWATYYGGSGADEGLSCAVGLDGGVYLAGTTSSASAISSSGHQGQQGGSTDAFLVKFNSAGERQWATYYGGSGPDVGAACAVGVDGDVYLAGGTESGAAMASNGHQNVLGGSNDAFLVKFDPNGVRQWATYYGGSGFDNGFSCAADQLGNIYLAGACTSNGMASGGHQNTFGGGDGDAFLVKFNGGGERQWATYYGGNGLETGRACAVTAQGNVYLAGHTNTPTSTSIAAGGHQLAFGGLFDAFLVKFNGAGVRQWGSYYGGSGAEQGSGCAAFGDERVYLAGNTNTTTGDAIAELGHQNVTGGGLDAYLVGFNAGGNGTSVVGTRGDRSFMAIWPNPTDGAITIDLGGLAQPSHLAVLDATGRSVHQRMVGNSTRRTTIDLHGLASGLYIVQVRLADGSMLVEQVVKE